MKDILVIATGGKYDVSRLESATGIARIFGSLLTAAVINEMPDPQVYAADPAIGIAALDSGIYEEGLKQGQVLQRSVVEQLSKLDSPASVVLVNEPRNRLAVAVSELARLSDLVVTTLPAESARSELMQKIIDGVLVDATCGVLCLAHGQTRSPVAEHAILAWNGSREAARALNSAMPLLRHAKKVTVLLVDQPLRTAGRDYRPGDEVLLRLRHFGVEAGLVRVASEGLTTADAITAEVKRLQADLLVIGAQAEGGLRQWLSSSVSRKVLADARLPLLIAH